MRKRNFPNVAPGSGRNPEFGVVSQLPGLKDTLHGLIDEGSCLDLQALLTVQGVLTHPCFITSCAIGPQFDPGYVRQIGHMIETGTQTRGEGSECRTIRFPPEESGHPQHVGLTPGTFCVPVIGPKIMTMNEHGAAREMELGVGPGGYTGIGPRHPG